MLIINERIVLYSSIITRKTPTFGGISLALRGSGAFGAPVGALPVPILETAAEGGGKRTKKKVGVLWAPLLGGACGAP